MTRRFVSLAAFVTIIAAALLLLYRVYLHHAQAEPYVDDDRAVVRLFPDTPKARVAALRVNFATHLS